MLTRIYLDNNSTTAVDPRVVTVVTEHMLKSVGNPSSIHSFGQEARQTLNRARQTLASYLNVKPQEIVFTSGGTEAAALILRGIFSCGSRGHIVTSNVEHPCVYATIKSLESEGCTCTYLSPGEWGAVTPESLQKAILPETKLIALMAVNNETGVKTDIEAIAGIALEAGIPLFVDGVALLGKENFSIPQGVSAMIFSGHKLHAPKGVGFAFVRSNLKLKPLTYGGEQEKRRRPGTENLPGIVGLAKAVELLQDELPSASLKMQMLRDRLEKGLLDSLSGVTVNGLGPRVVNTCNVSFADIEGELLLSTLDLADAGLSIAVSHGSACASGALEPSRILLNMGFSRERAAGSVRFSLSRFNTVEEIDMAVDAIVKCVKRLR